jgi:DNA-binding NarL/FixJ family response regulator
MYEGTSNLNPTLAPESLSTRESAKVMKQQTRVLLVDGRPLLRAAIAALLARDISLEVVESHDSAAIAARVKEVRPHVVLVGVDLGAELEAITPGVHGTPPLPFVAFSSRSDKAFLHAARQAGYAGVVLASAPATILNEAISAAAGGRTFVDANGHAAVGSQGIEVSVLSGRERQVLKLLSEGQSTKQIASLLGLSGKTIETHRLRIMRKLKLFSVAELTKYAIRHGLTHV